MAKSQAEAQEGVFFTTSSFFLSPKNGSLSDKGFALKKVGEWSDNCLSGESAFMQVCCCCDLESGNSGPFSFHRQAGRIFIQFGLELS